MLLSTFTADGNGTACGWPGGYGSFWVFKTSGTGTIKLQWKPAGSTGDNWIDVKDLGGTAVSLTASGNATFAIGGGSIRAVAASTGSTPSFDVGVGGILGEAVRF